MARLTNRQMEVLAERVTDLLEEQHKLENKAVKESNEYKDFEIKYTDSEIEEIKAAVNSYRLAKSKIEELEEEMKKYKRAAIKVGEKMGFLDENSYYQPEPKIVLERALRERKNAKFGAIEFNRDKTLRRVQADILLSDVQNPEELVKSLVEKLKG